MLRVVLAGLLALLSTCCVTHTDPRSPIPYGHPMQVLYLLGDVDFTPQERAWIKQATDNLAAQTHGYVSITVDYNLDYSDADSLEASWGRDKLIKVGMHADQVQDFDSQHCCLLGLTVWPMDASDLATSVYLVYDRLEDEDEDEAVVPSKFVHVTMHELLHALGLRHVNDIFGLMYRSTSGGEPNALNCSDYREASRAWGASVRRLSGGRCTD